MRVPTATRLESVKEYYFSKKLREVATLIQAGKPVLNIGIGSPDLPPHPSITDALTAAMLHPRANMYQSYQGLPELREAIAHFYHRSYSVTLDPSSEILPLMGSKEGIMHISMAFLNKGDEVLIPNPGYPTYSAVTQLVEATPVFYNLTAENSKNSKGLLYVINIPSSGSFASMLPGSTDTDLSVYELGFSQTKQNDE